MAYVSNAIWTILAALLLGFLGLLGFILKLVVDYYRDPLDLRKYPAPSLLAAMTPLWSIRESWLGRRYAALHEQHERLGDVIRVGPNQLCFNDPEAVIDIYGHKAASKLGKDFFYDALAGTYHDIVVSTDRAEHSRKRKYMANSFALKNVTRMEPVIRDKIRLLLEQIDKSCGETLEDRTGRSMDFRNWYAAHSSPVNSPYSQTPRFNYLTFDVIGTMGFGQPLGFLENGGDSTMTKRNDRSVEYRVPSLIYAVIGSVRYSGTVAQLTSILPVGAIQKIKSILQTVKPLFHLAGGHHGVEFEDVVRQHLRSRLDRGDLNNKNDFLQSILVDKEGRERNLPFLETMAESSVILGAGSATTTAALSSCLWFLLNNPSCFWKLRTEVDSIWPFSGTVGTRIEDDIVPYDRVKNLPYLRACIHETLRLRPPLSHALPRRVIAPEGTVVAGRYLRHNTVAAVSPYTIHRNKTLYRDPESFCPDRWLKAEVETNPQKDMEIHNLKTYNIPFSQGSRACIGRHIAIVEQQILLATLVRRYDMRLVEEGQQLTIFEAFNANPGPLPIKVIKRQVVS
jgi:cytochrome P450